MRKNGIWWLIGAIVAVAIFGAPYVLSGNSSAAPATPADSEVSAAESLQQGCTTFASWAEGFSSVRDLSAASVAVVVGHVEGKKQVAEQALLFTDFEVVADGSLKGRVRAGDHITVHQTGGVRPGGAIEEVCSDPLLETGTRYLLFLKYSKETGRYFVAGGPQGRFVVQEDKVIPLSDVYPDRGIASVPIGTMSLDQIAASVR